jgi:hypothetical protein
MNLKMYLFTNNMTFIQLGELIDANPRYLSLISQGKLLPSSRLARDIENATNGVVKIIPSQRKRKKPIRQQKQISKRTLTYKQNENEG